MVFSLLFIVVWLITWSLNINVTLIAQTHPVTLVMMISLAVIITGILVQRQTAKEKNTLEFEQKYKHNQNLTEKFYYVIELCHDKNLEQIAQDKTAKEYNAIVEILNEWERTANAIKHDLYDEPMLYQIYGSTVIHLWVRLQPFIQFRQKDNVRLYLNFSALASRWQIRRAKEDVVKQPEQLASSIKALHQASLALTKAQEQKLDIDVNQNIKVDSQIKRLEAAHKVFSKKIL